ncbi:MAG: hypothetical protein HY763_04225 [Planctomycetes bacterium]|nr:hypothetical protein [Planctomycetota bacterium]
MRTRPLMAGFLALSTAAAAQADPTYMFVTDSVNQLLRVELPGGHTELVGSTAAQFTDIAADSTGRLFGVTGRYVYEIDPGSGWSRLIGSHGFGEAGSIMGIDSLTFDHDGRLYAAGDNFLAEIDPLTGAGTARGTISGYRSAGDLTVDAAGRLLLSTDAGVLVELNRSRGGASRVGSIPYIDVFALATTLDGEVFGIRSTNQIVRINPQTGAATRLSYLSGDFLIGRAWGAAIPTPLLPEPMTWLLAVAGMIALVTLRHR